MVCEDCRKFLATVHLTELAEKQYKETHLCERCARVKGVPFNGDAISSLRPLPRPPMKTMFLVSAQLQSGKDQFGEALRKEVLGVGLAFAQPVKEVAIAMLGMPARVAYGGEVERRAWKRYCKDKASCPNATHDACTDAREWLQWIGTELGRVQIDPDVWAHRLLERAPGFAGDVVVTDARFKNELDTPGSVTPGLGYGNTHLERPFRLVKIRLKRPGHENDIEHASEKEQTEIPDSAFDEVVVNDGTLQDLESKAKVIARKYLA